MHSHCALVPRRLALSDLHVAFPENREFIENRWPESAADWLLVAGDGEGRYARLVQLCRSLGVLTTEDSERPG
jgi:hypothetical protein